MCSVWNTFLWLGGSEIFRTLTLVGRTPAYAGGHRGSTDGKRIRAPSVVALNGLDESEARMRVISVRAVHDERSRGRSLEPGGSSIQSYHSRVARFERSTGFEAPQSLLDLDQLLSLVQRVVFSQSRSE